MGEVCGGIGEGHKGKKSEKDEKSEPRDGLGIGECNVEK
jgi:hypothetical protein